MKKIVFCVCVAVLLIPLLWSGMWFYQTQVLNKSIIQHAKKVGTFSYSNKTNAGVLSGESILLIRNPSLLVKFNRMSLLIKTESIVVKKKMFSNDIHIINPSGEIIITSKNIQDVKLINVDSAILNMNNSGTISISISVEDLELQNSDRNSRFKADFSFGYEEEPGQAIYNIFLNLASKDAPYRFYSDLSLTDIRSSTSSGYRINAKKIEFKDSSSNATLEIQGDFSSFSDLSKRFKGELCFKAQGQGILEQISNMRSNPDLLTIAGNQGVSLLEFVEGIASTENGKTSIDLCITGKDNDLKIGNDKKSKLMSEFMQMSYTQ